MFMFAYEISNTRDIDEKSQIYVDKFGQYLEDSSIEDLDQDNIDKSIIVGTNETGSSSITDFLANINYYSGRIARIKGYIDLTYNMPSFFVASLGLPLGSFRHVINIMTTIMFIAILILIVKLIRGS